MGKRKKVEKITYRTLKAEIRALLGRPGVVEDAEDRILDWLLRRERDRQIEQEVEKAFSLSLPDLAEIAKQEQAASKWNLSSEFSSHPDAVNITYRMTRKIPTGIPQNDVKEITLARDDIAGLMAFMQSVEQGE